MSVRKIIIMGLFLAIYSPGIWAAPPEIIYAEQEPVSGAVNHTTQPHSGSHCLQWKHGENAALRFLKIPRDWTPWDTLTMWLRTDTPQGVSWMLIIASEDPTKEGMDYYSARITVQPGPWQRVSLYLKEDFNINRFPRGWDQIDGMTFHAAGWEQQLNKEAIVYVDDVQLETQGPVQGPRLSDEEFFLALNLDWPGLEKVKQAAEAQDWAGARREYVSYLRSTPRPWHFDWRAKPSQPQPNYDTRRADEILARRFVVVSVPYDFKGGDIDWTVNPTNPVNHEWVWQFSRHSFWVDLGRAYWATLDEKYAQEFVWQLQDWIKDCPVPQRVNNGVGSRWRTIECGIRMGQTWPNAFFYFLSSPSFTEDAIINMMKSFVEHARYLRSYPTSGNWLTMECNGLYHVGALFPEFKEAEGWRQTAVERMYAELENQVYPDGAQIELAPGYHWVALVNFKMLYDVARLTGFSLPPDYLAKLERMWDYLMWIADPEGQTPALNDSGRTNVRSLLQEGLKYFPARQDWKYIATGGQEGQPPAKLSLALSWPGHYVMRTGWGREDLYCFFEAGPFGYGHQHEDKLGFVLNAYGSSLVIDTGVYTYDASEWRRYVLGPYAHNTVFVDGKGQNRRGEPRETYVNKQPETNPWLSTEGLDYVAGIYNEGFGSQKERLATHRREIIFVKPDYWLIVDTLTPADEQPHHYTAYFHLRPPEARIVEGTKNIVTDNGDKANLAILPIRLDKAGPQALEARVIKGQKEPFLLGWTLKSGLECEPIPVATFEWQATGASQIAYVFYPLRPQDKELPLVTATAEGFIVQKAKQRDEIKLADKPRVFIIRQKENKMQSVLQVVLP